ncbi:unnamed protein product [Rotaria magnacalcarata]|uniref:Uncharacterized protein n=1 Tax=Rotaria magnacalcarata TaxID=392030 RepID=A0A815ICB6_9BILA|nr:unnamed protein product [Rotaria magnacalcarata]CAF1406396.1 unnamed protein product [Rotaria magnacalcarata]CAF1978818.1 unnamed protein product [Rotaria magnacalcarata]CAF2027358.1 unnamed protein product [Rotaria magnacalcarata]CAF2154310.1 unnamed protein product [Rotaria magnacalcarata]
MNSLLILLVLISSAVVCNAKWTDEKEPVASLLTSAKHVCGGTSPLTRWARTGRSDTIEMTIDTGSCQFENTPMYFTSISGDAGHYLLVGVNAIYKATRNGFLISVFSARGESADTLMAWSAQYNWNVNWFGVLP